jgi:hypothetical protein
MLKNWKLCFLRLKSISHEVFELPPTFENLSVINYEYQNSHIISAELFY